MEMLPCSKRPLKEGYIADICRYVRYYYYNRSPFLSPVCVCKVIRVIFIIIWFVSDGNVAPCALILGLIYIQRLARVNPAYLARSIPAEVFLTSMVGWALIRIYFNRKLVIVVR